MPFSSHVIVTPFFSFLKAVPRSKQICEFPMIIAAFRNELTSYRLLKKQSPVHGEVVVAYQADRQLRWGSDLEIRREPRTGMIAPNYVRIRIVNHATYLSESGDHQTLGYS